MGLCLYDVNTPDEFERIVAYLSTIALLADEVNYIDKICLVLFFPTEIRDISINGNVYHSFHCSDFVFPNKTFENLITGDADHFCKIFGFKYPKQAVLRLGDLVIPNDKLEFDFFGEFMTKLNITIQGKKFTRFDKSKIPPLESDSDEEVFDFESEEETEDDYIDNFSNFQLTLFHFLRENKIKAEAPIDQFIGNIIIRNNDFSYLGKLASNVANDTTIMNKLQVKEVLTHLSDCKVPAAFSGSLIWNFKNGFQPICLYTDGFNQRLKTAKDLKAYLRKHMITYVKLLLQCPPFPGEFKIVDISSIKKSGVKIYHLADHPIDYKKGSSKMLKHFL